MARSYAHEVTRIGDSGATKSQQMLQCVTKTSGAGMEARRLETVRGSPGGSPITPLLSMLKKAKLACESLSCFGVRNS